MDIFSLLKSVNYLNWPGFLVRTIFVGILLVIMGKLIPRRAAGGMSAFDFTFFWMMGGLIASPLFDAKISFRDTIIAAFTVLLTHKAIAKLGFEYPKLDSIIKGTPALIINNGQIDQKAMSANLINNEILISELRKNDAFNLSTIQFAYYENNGHLSVLTYPEYQSVTKKDLNLPSENTFSPQLIISDGKVDLKSLIRTNMNSPELLREIHKQGYNLRDIFLGYWESTKTLILKGRQNK